MKNNISKISFILLLICIASCSQPEKKAQAKKKQVPLQLQTLSAGHLRDHIQLPGVLEPFEYVQIYPRVNGFVREVNADRGTAVKKGAVLMRLDAPEIEERRSAARLKYMEAQALYFTSKDKYERLLQASHTSGTVSAYDIGAARAHMQADSATAAAQLANYRAAEDMFSFLTVTAPFDGVITERNVHPGALVGPDGKSGEKPMLVLQQQAKLRMVVNVPEEYSMQIQDKDPVQFRINALPGQQFTGYVSRSSGTLSDKFRSETIEIDVSNTNRKFKPGMYAEVDLPASGNNNAFVVPKSAVVTTTERKYVIVAKDNKARWTDVTEGNQQEDSVEVFGMLQPGDHVVTNASYEIKDNSNIGGNKMISRR